MRRWWSWAALALTLVSLTRIAGAQPQADAGVAEPAPASDDRKQEARQHFDRGRELLKEEAWDAALAEFLRSRELYPSKGNTQSAAFCLGKLQRFDEALDLLEALLREFPSLPNEERTAAETEMTRLRTRVGSIEVRGAQPGASVVVDGRTRGSYPLRSAARVPAGSHVVRVYKEGFSPYETRVEVAGGQVVAVEATLGALTQAGRLKVSEQSGKVVEVVLDNVVVGKTPWEGSLAVGTHQVRLQGEGEIGTQPASAEVRLNQLTTLTLAVEPLGSFLRVEPVPVSATVAIDSVTVGAGIWEGRLRAGGHRIEVAQEGFVPQTRDLALVKGRREHLRVSLVRDPSSPLWRTAQPQGLFLDVFAAAPLGLGLGGELSDACSGSCTASIPVGGMGVLRAGYQLGSGLAFAVDVGYLLVTEKVEGRGAVLAAVPSGNPRLDGTANDRLTLRGLTLGISGAYHTRGKLSGTFRLSTGAWLATMVDRRSGTFGGVAVGPAEESNPARYLYVAPELRGSYALSDHLEVGVGVDVMVLVALTQPAWQDDKVVAHPALGLAQFGSQTNAGNTLLLVAPGIGARYLF